MGQVILVRHGQASWGAADYDVLSPLGETQATAVGRALKDVQPTVVVHGEMKRQADTARLAVEAAGWAIQDPTEPAVGQVRLPRRALPVPRTLCG
ncbi:MAG: histidine phosphatase family protein [Marmoricola sp.]